MKRQVQYPGVKRWSGNDLLDLQVECLKICDQFLGQFGAGVLSGCQVNGSTISSGLVFLDGKVMPFAGAVDVALYPVYLKVKKTEKMREYADNVVRPIAEEYVAELVTQQPVDEPLLTIQAENNPTFFELLQNDSRLFFTKTEREKLKKIEAEANKIIVDSQLSEISTNPVQNKIVKAALDGKSDNNHTHNYAGSDMPGGAANSVKYSLNIKLNGITQGEWNGNSAKTIDITASSTGGVPVSRKINGKSLSNDIVLTPADIEAVPTTRKVNGKELSANISLTASDVGAVPTTRTVNGKELSGNITLLPGDIGAAPVLHTHNYAGSSTPGGAANSVVGNLIIQFNGTSQGAYNGASDKTLNITAAAIGAALGSHTHNYAGSVTPGGDATNALRLEGVGSTGFGRAYSSSYSFGGSPAEITTEQFINMLKDMSAFSYPYWIARGGWSYAHNGVISDTGIGRICLAGAVVEVMGNSSAYTIRITTPTTATSSGEIKRVFIYVNNGAGYAPGWFKLANSTDQNTPNPLTIQLNSVSQGGWNGSSAKTINITAANVGAAAASHSHNYAGSSTPGGAATYANMVIGTYSGGGGQLPPSAVGKSTVRWLMSNANVNGHANYKDWMYMDTYGVSDVPYVTAFGISKSTQPRAFIMVGSLGASAWTASAELWTTYNFNPSGYAAASHTHNYAASSTPGGAANAAIKLSALRTINLTGAVTGSVAFDGSNNVTMNTSLGNMGLLGAGKVYGPGNFMIWHNSRMGNITVTSTTLGEYKIYHSLNTSNYYVLLTPQFDVPCLISVNEVEGSYFTVKIMTYNGSSVGRTFNFAVFGG